MIVRIVTTVATVMLLTAGALPAEPVPAKSRTQNATTQPTGNPAASLSATAPAGPICVAILEPEVLADMPAEQRKALAGAIDTLLTESLAKQNGFVLVDRQALDKVLSEHKALAGGASDSLAGGRTTTRLTADQVAQPLRQFWSAGVLICSTIQQDGKDGGKLAIRIEAVAAQTGQKLAELMEPGTWRNGQWVGALAAGKSLATFCRDIRPQLARNAGLPLVEIAAGQLFSDLGRSQWMVDDLVDAIRVETGCDRHCVLLTPRHAASTKEERLLRLMGLTDRRWDDASARLAPAPNFRLECELHEQVTDGLAYDKTPLTLKLAWRTGTGGGNSTSLQGLAGQWDALRAKAMEWVRKGRGGLPAAPTADSEDAARQMAQQELALARSWQGVRFSDGGLEAQRRNRLVGHALRAAHLDPTNEEAAYEAAMNIDAPYAVAGLADSQQCQDRIIAECQRYLDRFGRQMKKDRRQEVVDRIAMAAFRCETIVSRRRGLALSSRQNQELYRYASLYLPAWLERDAAGAAGKRPSNPGFGNLWACSWMLRLDLIMNCPPDRLDEEYGRWRTFWKTRIENIRGEVPPWDVIEVFFQIRYKDWRKAREAYQRLAEKHDESFKQVWRYGNTPLLPHTLRAAGDPEWSTWRPDHAGGLARQVQQNDFEYAVNLFWPAFLDMGPSGPALPVSKMTLPRQAGEAVAWGAKPADILACIDKQVWIVSPGIDRSNAKEGQLWLFDSPPESPEARKPVGNEHWLGAKAVPANVLPREVPWPPCNGKAVRPAITCRQVLRRNGQVDLFLGTAANGIVRFTRTGNAWIGKWLTAREGLPVEAINSMCECELEGKKTLVAMGYDSRKEQAGPPGQRRFSGGDTVLWTIDPDGGTVKILFRGGYEQLKNAIKADPVRRAYYAIRLSSLMEGIDIEGVAARDVLEWQDSTVSVDGRTWRVDGGALTELSPKTLKPLGQTIGKTTQWPYLPGSDAKHMVVFFGSLFWKQAAMDATCDWPVTSSRLAASWQGRLVMILGSEFSENVVALYKPAPPGSNDWAARDQWAFYRAPERSTIRSLYTDAGGDLWLATTAGLLRLNAAQLPSLDACFKTVKSTRQWRDNWLGKQDNLWKRDAAFHVIHRQWSAAMDRIARREADEANWRMSDDLKKQDRLAIPLWRARVYAEEGKFDQAIEIYAAMAANRNATDAVRLLSRICQVLVLNQAQRWQDMVSTYEKTASEFPQISSSKVPIDALGSIVDQARRKIGARPAAPAAKKARP